MFIVQLEKSEVLGKGVRSEGLGVVHGATGKVLRFQGIGLFLVLVEMV